MGLTTTRSHDAAFTYEQMRALARCSMHDNTVAQPAFPATDTPDVWPGEPPEYPQAPTIHCRCGRVVPRGDAYWSYWIPPEMWDDSHIICLDCYLQARPQYSWLHPRPR